MKWDEEPADDILNAIKPGPFEEYQKRLEEELDKFNKKHSKDLAEQTDNLKDELIDNYEERLKKLSETPFKLSERNWTSLIKSILKTLPTR